MNDNEIVKALECCCKNNDCNGCPLDYCNFSSECASKLALESLDLINRLQAEVERLEIVHYCIDKVILGKQEFAIADEYLIAYQNALERLYNNINLKSEARKELSEKIKDILRDNINISNMDYNDIADDIDNLLKELDGKEKENA